MLATVKPFAVEVNAGRYFYYEDLTQSRPLQAEVKFARHSFPGVGVRWASVTIVSFPGSGAREKRRESGTHCWYRHKVPLVTNTDYVFC